MDCRRRAAFDSRPTRTHGDHRRSSKGSPVRHASARLRPGAHAPSARQAGSVRRVRAGSRGPRQSPRTASHARPRATATQRYAFLTRGKHQDSISARVVPSSRRVCISCSRAPLREVTRRSPLLRAPFSATTKGRTCSTDQSTAASRPRPWPGCSDGRATEGQRDASAAHGFERLSRHGRPVHRDRLGARQHLRTRVAVRVAEILRPAKSGLRFRRGQAGGGRFNEEAPWPARSRQSPPNGGRRQGATRGPSP